MTNKKKMLTVNEAIKKITSNFSILDDEEIELTSATGRILAKPIISKINNPISDVSSMDGYAICSKNLLKKYKVVGESSAGKPYNKKVKKTETIRIYTGSVMPEGTDSVLIQENVKLKKNIITDLNYSNFFKKQNVRKKGLNFKQGEIILQKNLAINSRSLGSISMSGNFWLNVRRKPLIGILSTGNELEKVGQLNDKNKVPSGNNVMLSSMINILGAIPRILPIAKDDEKCITDIIERNLDCNLIVTTGGASVGKYDLMNKIFNSKTKHTKINFWKIAMRPGKPLVFGQYKNTPILGLPGNPVSAGVCALIFLRAAIYKMLGLKNFLPDITNGIIDHSLKKNDERMDFLRGSVTVKKGQNIVRVFPKQDSSMINLFASSNCLVIRNPLAKELKAGQSIKFIKYSGNF